MTTIDERLIEQTLLALLAQRGAGKTICPSEVARRLAPTDWRPLMDPIREVADRLVVEGRVEVTQAGEVVDRETAKGPIRLRLV